MRSFTLDGITYEYENPEGFETAEEVRSWEYGHYPKVMATIPLAGGGTMDVYAEATRWSLTHVSVHWLDDRGDTSWAWIPKDNVRTVTESEWDIDQYHRCPEDLRVVQWGKRLPGFLPAD